MTTYTKDQLLHLAPTVRDQCRAIVREMGKNPHQYRDPLLAIDVTSLEVRVTLPDLGETFWFDRQPIGCRRFRPGSWVGYLAGLARTAELMAKFRAAAGAAAPDFEEVPDAAIFGAERSMA